MQTGVIGTLWHQDAGDLVDRLDAAFRAGVRNGSGAARCSEQLEGCVLACLTLPSNKPSCPPPDPVQVFKTTGLLVAADVWLVNAAQLRTHLGLAQNTCAAQLIGKLYQTEGEAGLDRLSGDYAFVIYDSDAEKIIARRDPFGVRPLFWAMIGPSVAFSSLPETLVDAGLIEGQRDAAGVLDMIARSAADRPATLTKGLNRIPAAMQMTLQRGDKVPVFKRYWTPKPQAESVPQSFEAWTGALRQKMEKAVQSRLPDAGDLAASVSSGLDSTSVVMLAERNLQAGQHIFASTYAASQEAEKAYPGMLDETEVAAQVVAGSNSISWEKIRYRKNAELTNVVIGAATWVPDADLNPEFRTAKNAAMQGADTMLTGWGGDNVVSYKGYGVASSLLKTGK
ncbi:asparagine synthase-related protein, partial [Planktotalea sp.]|uniref:asparagine synthase-related protein n=1 Tax=Planktotalea sp. TaxID=2029877 RepID=UPI00329A724F